MKKMKKLLALMCIAIAALIWLPGLKFPVEAGGILRGDGVGRIRRRCHLINKSQ